MPLLDALPSLFPMWECQSLNSDVARKGKHPSRIEIVGHMGRGQRNEQDVLSIFLALWLYSISTRERAETYTDPMAETRLLVGKSIDVVIFY